MIFSRRQAHHTIFSILIVVLPIAFIAALVLRPQYPPLSADAEPLIESSGFATDIEDPVAVATETLKGKGIRLEVAAITTEGDRVLDVKPSQVLKAPDLLLYWQADDAAPEELDEDALLLGALAGRSRRRFALPQAMQGQAGQLVIYSNGTQRIISTVELPPELTQ
ncbi:MAG: hypothetical protein AAGG51_01270 [Cyanobacteria bacterium P01_G01_bin.54]